ncbi:hypothetical protein EJ08DRAFT_652193 [Tothia fuscella]|uniref:Uncharacterized protein n=1 Tax=Tothia fuscella TaxID=1048955 RepID=A0A9P4NKS0_9PEZI|nr:hypothetical protein EJ08DRAFT_652193 [Tothia fuscella]
MPRDGTGASDNKVEETHDVIHGAGKEESSHVDRADKTAPMPEIEKGAAVEGLSGSGGGSQGLSTGPEAGQGGRRQ